MCGDGVVRFMKSKLGQPHQDLDSIVVTLDNICALPFGNLQRVSPQEQDRAIQQAIQHGASDEELQRWREMVLTLTSDFRKLETDKLCFFHSVNCRLHMVVSMNRGTPI